MNHRTAFLFPGQGSQSLGMLQSFIKSDPVLVKRVFDEASQALHYDLLALIEKGPEDQLNKTEITQPALLATSYLIWQVWQARQDALPAIMAGHSLGEYSALVCAEAISFSDAIKLVALRGTLMQAAAPDGHGLMAAIVGLNNEAVATLCRDASPYGCVVPANDNAPGQVVISGEKNAVEWAAVEAKKRGAKLAKVLAVSVASHSPLMMPAAEELAQAMESIVMHSPKIPVIHNVNVKTTKDPLEIKQWLVAQLYQPVRWVETIQALIAEGHTQFFECGPNRVLTGLCKRIDSGCQCISLCDSDSIDAVLTEQVGV